MLQNRERIHRRRRPTLAGWLMCVAVVGLGLSTARAQDPALPRIQVVHAGAQTLLADVEALMKLAGTPGEETWPTVRDTLGIFLAGVDPKRPLRLDFVLTSDSYRQVWFVPIADIETFLTENLAGIGFETKKLGDDLWSFNLSGSDVSGFLRHVHGYAVLSSSKEDVLQELADPAAAAKPLLDGGASLALHVENPPDGQQQRRAKLQDFRRETLAALKQGTQETPAQFALRKTVLERALIEAERLLVESRSLTVQWKLQTDDEQAPGVTRLALRPIAGTSLEDAIAALGKRPSRFAGWKPTAETALFLLVNHPLDPLRREHAAAVLEKLKDALEERIQQSDRPEDQRAKLSEALQGFYELLRDTAAAGLADSIIDVRSNGDGTFRLVGGVRSPDGHRFDRILALWAAGRSGRSVKTVSVDGLANPDVHVFRVTLSDKERADVAKVLGAHDTILIATAKEAVWYAAGRDAESALKAIVQASVADGENDGETEEESPDIVRGLVSVKPWLQLRDKLFPRSNEDSAVAGTPEERQRQVLLKSLRKHVDESLTNENGRVRFRLRRDGNGVSGESTVGIGLLRALGKFITQYAAENLQ